MGKFAPLTFNQTDIMKHVIKSTILVIILAMIALPTTAIADEYGDAQKAVEEKDYVRALELIRQAIAKDPQDIDRLRLGAKIYLEMNILDTALAYAKRVHKDDDDIKEHVLLYASALIATDNAAEACVAIKKFRKGADDV
ncbi:MAG: hypothetical protein RLZZ273_415, partial [Bacteroidota bacterium]